MGALSGLTLRHSQPSGYPGLAFLCAMVLTILANCGYTSAVLVTSVAHADSTTPSLNRLSVGIWMGSHVKVVLSLRLSLWPQSIY